MKKIITILQNYKTMVSNENKTSMSSTNDDEFANFEITVKYYLDNINIANQDNRIFIMSELFDYMLITKNIWRFNPKIVDEDPKFLDTLIYKIRDLRLSKYITTINKERVEFILRNMEHRLDLFCSVKTKKNKLCCNRIYRPFMRMCTMHGNKECKNSNKSVVYLVNTHNFPTVVAKIISLYIYI